MFDIAHSAPFVAKISTFIFSNIGKALLIHKSLQRQKQKHRIGIFAVRYLVWFPRSMPFFENYKKLLAWGPW